MKKRALVIIGIAIAAVVILVLYLVYINVFVNKHRYDLVHAKTGGSQYRNIAAEYSIMPSYMWMRVTSILFDDDYAVSDYLLEGRLADQDAEPSGKFLLSDQSLLLLKYIAAGERGSAVKLVKKVNNDFRNEDGSYRHAVYKDGTADTSYTNTDEILFLEAYVEYYSAYGSDSDLENIRKLISLVFDDKGMIKPENLKAANYVSSDNVSGDIPDDVPDPSFDDVYGTEDVTVSGGSGDSKTVEFKGVKISDIKLELISNLEKNGLIAQGAYDSSLKLIQGSLASADIPYYAYAYTVTDSGEVVYIYSGGRAATMSVAESLKTMINLAQADQLPDTVYQQFKANLINDGILKGSYYIATGLTGGGEIYGSYCDVMQLSELKGDTDLYTTVCRIISSRVATNKQSRALYLVFRDENNRYRFYSGENIKIYLLINGMFSV